MWVVEEAEDDRQVSLLVPSSPQKALGFQFQRGYSPACRLLTSQCLSALICKMGVIITMLIL